MSDTAAATGTKTHKVEFEGEVYTLSPLTYGLQGKYTAWLEQQRLATTFRLMGGLPSAVQDKLLSSTVEAISHSGDYEWDGAVTQRSLDTDAGKAYALYLSLLAHHLTVGVDDARRMLKGKRGEVNVALAMLNPSVWSLVGDGGVKSPTPDGDAPPKGETPADASSAASPTGV